MSDYEQERSLQRERFRQLHPHPSSPRHRRLPRNDENVAPPLLDEEEQTRRATLRAATRQADVQTSPKKRRKQTTNIPSSVIPSTSSASVEDPFVDVTPARRPLQVCDDNHAPLLTPPQSQATGELRVFDSSYRRSVEESNLNRRQIAQRKRRERERLAKAQNVEQTPTEQNAGQDHTDPTSSFPRIDLRAVRSHRPQTSMHGNFQYRPMAAHDVQDQLLTPPSTQTPTEPLESIHARLRNLRDKLQLDAERQREWEEIEGMENEWREIEARIRRDRGEREWKEIEARLRSIREARDKEERMERELEEREMEARERLGREQLARERRAEARRRGQQRRRERERLLREETERRTRDIEEQAGEQNERDREQEGNQREGQWREMMCLMGLDNDRAGGRERERERDNRESERRQHENPFIHTRGFFCAARRPYSEPMEQHDFGPMNVACPECGAMHWYEEHTDGNRTRPLFGMCCDKGKVELPVILPPPEALQNLLTGHDRMSTEFRENIAQYNSALAFTSVGVKTDNQVNHRGRGQPVFRIQGELKHWAGSLLPQRSLAPAYAQTYILDPHAAHQTRMQRNGNLEPRTMQILQDMLAQHNPYTRLYVQAYEVLRQYPNSPNYTAAIRLRPGQDKRRYNEPRADEVAILVHEDENKPFEKRDIILRLRAPDGEHPLQRMWDSHPAYTPLHYVLLFPFGEPGWEPTLRLHEPQKEQPSRLTLTRYTAYRLHPRADDWPLIFRSGRLFHRYLVDMWACADQQRLFWLKENQANLRASLYKGLEDAINHGDTNFENVGQRIILPSSYVGGPRYMHQRFQDAMALVRHYKKVDLFITVTANPNWSEITRELLPGQTAYDRPELVARIFRLKKKAIIDEIYKKGIFGRAVAYVYTIEFQKRGLPHMHLLVILQDDFKLRTPDDVDTCIRAYWPDPETEPQLFEIVKNNMVHGPCGAANPGCVCMEDGKCQKNFPKDFQERTVMDENGYPKYRRPDDGRKYLVGRHWVDNSWIVPYCPYLSLKFNCHINVECAATIAAVKYTVKYVHKGGDRGSLEIGERDEVKLFIEGRYFSASEAAWRIFHFDIHDQDPPVQPLQVHLPGEQMVVFDPNNTSREIIDRAAFAETSLTAFFRANAQDGAAGVEARQHLYQDFPAHYVFNKGNRSKNIPAKWTPRKKGFSIGRMYYVPPTAGERFYLRKLLTVVRGPTSFESLRTFNNVVYPEFRDACLARGLLSDDQEWRHALEDARLIKTGRQLRLLFTTILLFCTPAKPEDLWTAYRADICDDLEYQLRQKGFEAISENDIYDYGLYLVEQILQESGRCLHDFPRMPEPVRDWRGAIDNPLITEQLNYDRDEERTAAEARIAQMNKEQLTVFNTVMTAVREKTSRVFFLDGPGGTGKTFVYNTLCHAIRGEGWIVICVASTGIAALILPGGRTGHSVFKIPIEGLTGQSTCAIPKNSLRADLIRQTRLIIYDEAPMQHKYGFEAIDRTLRDIKETNVPFGGIPVILGGDFKQILPVVPKGSREDIVAACLQRSYLWAELTVLKLRRNMRLQQDQSEQEFASWLLDVGSGKQVSPSDSTIPFPAHMKVNSYEDLVNYVYADVHPDAPSAPAPEYFLDRAILAPRNVDVFATNTEILNRMPGEESVFYSEDTIIDRDGDLPPLPEEYLRSLDPAGLPPGELHIKVGCPLILLRNLAPIRGLCNGTRMVVIRATRWVLEVKLIGGDHHGEHAFIPRIVLVPSDQAAMPFSMRRLQYPVRLAFAMSINKSQGQSITTLGLDLRSSVFSHGQLYVALSRVTSSHRLRILLAENTHSYRTVNVVYNEVLLD